MSLESGESGPRPETSEQILSTWVSQVVAAGLQSGFSREAIRAAFLKELGAVAVDVPMSTPVPDTTVATAPKGAIEAAQPEQGEDPAVSAFLRAFMTKNDTDQRGGFGHNWFRNLAQEFPNSLKGVGTLGETGARQPNDPLYLPVKPLGSGLGDHKFFVFNGKTLLPNPCFYFGSYRLAALLTHFDVIDEGGRSLTERDTQTGGGNYAIKQIIRPTTVSGEGYNTVMKQRGKVIVGQPVR